MKILIKVVAAIAMTAPMGKNLKAFGIKEKATVSELGLFAIKVCRKNKKWRKKK